MLTALTLASGPIEKLSKALTTKYEKQAKTKVCQQIRQKEELYLSFARNLWMGGCVTTTVGLNERLWKDNKKKLEEMHKSMKEQTGEFYNLVDKYCTIAWTDVLNENKVNESIISNLYSGMGCNDVPEEEVHE